MTHSKKTIADTIFYHANIFTADDRHPFAEAIAIKEGYIIAIGATEEIKQYYVGQQTQQIDVLGNTLMPSIIDCHMHPFWGGKQLLGCSLEYKSLTVQETLEIIQIHLNQDSLKSNNDWLHVQAWMRQDMLPSGVKLTRFDLDTLNTIRPVILFANDCHTLVANSQALQLLGLNKQTPDPLDGKIGRNVNGELNGILEDAPAMRAYDRISGKTSEQNLTIAKNIQNLLHKQGVTTVMDARVFAEQLDAFKELKKQNQLYIRFLGAKEITPEEARTEEDAIQAVENVVRFAQNYQTTQWTPKADVSVCSIKFFIDGVLQEPIMTARLLQPYKQNMGTASEPNWKNTNHYGDLYFSQSVLNTLLLECAKTNLNPHMHTVADGAIKVALTAIKNMKHSFPHKDIRPALAHNEIVAPHQYTKFAKLNTTAILSFQWAGFNEQQSIENEKNQLGTERFEQYQTAAKFIDANARVAFGSDWPIDTFDEWYAFQVALTRRGKAQDGTLAPRLCTDRNMTLPEVLKSATIHAAYTLNKEQYIGSLSVGKFADLIVLDRNLFNTDIHAIGQTRVMLTMVGGEVVYQK